MTIARVRLGIRGTLLGKKWNQRGDERGVRLQQGQGSMPKQYLDSHKS